jgi:hypothetical protein
MEELTEVITSAQFHPEHCNIVMYSSSRGSIKLGDTRQAALCDNYAKILEVCSAPPARCFKCSDVVSLICASFIAVQEPEDASSKSFFSEIVASISHARLVHHWYAVTTRADYALQFCVRWSIYRKQRLSNS